MTENLETVQTYVRSDNTVTIVCPSCSLPRNASVGSYKNKVHLIKVRCPCGTVFKVSLNFRQFYRKPVDLPGVYTTIKPHGGGRGTISIKNISQGGIGFIVSGRNEIEKGHKLLISFELDDKKKTKLNKEVIVRSVEDDYIGCRFVDNKAYEKELGFYLKT